MPKPYRDFDSEERDLVRRSGLDRFPCPSLDLLLAARAGVIEQNEATPILSHLESCRFCQTLAAEFAQGESGHPSAANLRSIRARLDRQIGAFEPKALPWWRQWHFLAAVAGAAACVAIAIYIDETVPTRTADPKTVAEVQKTRFHLPLTAPPVKLSMGDAITWRSGDNTPSSEEIYLKELGTALAPYRTADYATAVGRLGFLVTKYPRSVEATFYLGVSQLFLNQPGAARLSLEKAESLHRQALRDEVQWFLSVAWERIGNPGQAAARLRPLCDAPGPYRDQACAALPHLR